MGTRVPRNDMPDKVSGKYVYMQHVRVPGMLHGRVVRPRGQSAYGAGAKILNVDESFHPQYPGRARGAQAAILSASWRRTSGTPFAPRSN